MTIVFLAAALMSPGAETTPPPLVRTEVPPPILTQRVPLSEPPPVEGMEPGPLPQELFDRAVKPRSTEPLSRYFSEADYPAAALRLEQQGMVGFALRINADGRPVGCVLTQMSGSAWLDSTTCRIMLNRSTFSPGRDRQGRPVESAVTGRIRWQLPQVSLPDVVRHSWTVDGDGAVQQCRSETIYGDRAEVRDSDCAPPPPELVRRVMQSVRSEGSTFAFRTEFHPRRDAVDWPKLGQKGERILVRSDVELDVRPDGTLGGCREVEQRSEMGPIPNPCVMAARMPTRGLKGAKTVRITYVVVATGQP